MFIYTLFHRTLPLLVTALLLFTQGCVGTPQTDPDGGEIADGGETLEDEFCEHMAEGPARSVEAGTDLDNAPDVTAPHTRFDVQLLGDGGSLYSGSVAYAVSEAGPHFIAFSDEVDALFFDLDGNEIAIDSLEPAGCDEVAQIRSANFAVGSVEIKLSSSSLSTVSLVIE